MSNIIYEAVNWNKATSELAQIFWDQQWKQIWFPEEIAVSKDIKQWKSFEHQDTYKKVFAGLTLLDTVQTNIGMNRVAAYTDDLQEKAVLTVFDAFEAIHAKSYSYIFTTLCTNEEIDELFEWVKKMNFYNIRPIKLRIFIIVSKKTIQKAYGKRCSPPLCSNLSFSILAFSTRCT